MDFYGKFRPIVTESNTVERKKLYVKFNEALNHGHIFVSAPTGYGKTLSVYLWLKSEGLDCTWINLDKHDNSLASFCENLKNASNSVSCRKAVKIPATNKTPELYRALDAFYLANESSVLVLDDFHFINDKDLLSYLNLVFKRTYASSRVVLISRSKPPESFLEMALNGEILIIGWQDLMFDEIETDFFLGKRG